MKSNREHFYDNERLIQGLDSKHILQILQCDAWKTTNQSITSAETNNDSNESPNLKSLQLGENTCGVDAFADLTFEKNVKRVLDVGGGKFDCCREFMKKQNIDLLVWDPYNRTNEHNSQIQKNVMAHQVDAATSMAVLNVIPESEARLAHINTLKKALAVNGVAYFKIWPGENSLKGTYTPTVNSYGYPGYQANAFPDRFIREVQIVFGADNAEIDSKIPNLIVARKKSDTATSEVEIKIIQEMARHEPWQLKRNRSSQQLFFKSASPLASEQTAPNYHTSTKTLYSVSNQ